MGPIIEILVTHISHNKQNIGPVYKPPFSENNVLKKTGKKCCGQFGRHDSASPQIGCEQCFPMFVYVYIYILVGGLNPLKKY